MKGERNMKKLDFDTFCLLDDARENAGRWTAEQFREYREEVLDVTRETVIPCEYLPVVLEYRKLEYSETDYGRNGKLSEVQERVELAMVRAKNLRYSDLCAHRPGNADLRYGRKTVEKKTGAGDWLVSHKHATREGIVKEYSRKKTLIHWEVKELFIDITCTWAELMDYLSHYRTAKNGPEKGAAFWFKSEPKATSDSDKWILEIQTYKTSPKKLDYLYMCPYNKAKMK